MPKSPQIRGSKRPSPGEMAAGGERGRGERAARAQRTKGNFSSLQTLDNAQNGIGIPKCEITG